MARHEEAFRRLTGAVRARRRALSPEATEAALSGGPVPGDLGAFAEKVRTGAADISEADLAGLRAAGRSEDEIFELIVAVAVGQADRRYRAGMAALTGFQTLGKK